MEKIKEDIAAMSANISAHAPEHMLKIVDPSGQLPVDKDSKPVEEKLSEARLKEFLHELFEDEETEPLTVD